jgi:hypothetical protein
MSLIDNTSKDQLVRSKDQLTRSNDEFARKSKRVSVSIVGPIPLLVSADPIQTDDPSPTDAPAELSFSKRLLTYNKWVLFALAMQYFNTGMRSMIMLALNDLFLLRYGIPPLVASELISFIGLPWTLKLFFGIITDSFPICGSTKRSYVLIMGLLQFVALLAVALFDWPTVEPVAIFVFIYSIGGAFEEVVCQGLMVVEAR